MTTQEIFNKIVTEKEKYPELSELNSTSKTAIWRLWTFIFAYFSSLLRRLFEDLKQDISEKIAKSQIGTLRWWISELKKFQYGDILIFKNGKWRYAETNPEKQIIAQVAIEQQDQHLIIKAAKFNNAKKLAQLELSELQSFTAYVQQIKFPGTLVNIISTEADELKLNYRVYYNALVDKNTIEAAIEQAVMTFLQDLIFNAKLSITSLTDCIKDVAGVVNPVFVSGEARSALNDIYLAIEDYYTAASGYMRLESLNLDLRPYEGY